MSNAFKHSFLKFERVVLIGGDCVSIQSSTIANAFEQLKGADCVIAPAQDGGFVLVGFNRFAFSSFVFDEIEWGGELVFRQFSENLKANNVSYSCLETLWDIDVPEDLRLLKPLPLFDSFF
jgi:glycosyltransferase A (GT-A) superfamily protein (DUF2064 family)